MGRRVCGVNTCSTRRHTHICKQRQARPLTEASSKLETGEQRIPHTPLDPNA